MKLNRKWNGIYIIGIVIIIGHSSDNIVPNIMLNILLVYLSGPLNMYLYHNATNISDANGAPHRTIVVNSTFGGLPRKVSMFSFLFTLRRKAL